MSTKKERRRSRPRWAQLLVAFSIALLAACGGGGDGGDPPLIDPGDPQPEPKAGQTEFVSADGRNGERSQDNGYEGNNQAGAPDENGGDTDGEERTVEEGDIYQVSSEDGLILNLNAYRGLQIIDFADPSDPHIVGRVQVSGQPVEMYQVGDRVFALVNDWQGYYGSRDDVLATGYNGGLVLAIDVSDPTSPTVTGRAQVPGYIRTSRLTRGGGQEALYVVSNEGGETFVRSFSVSAAGALDEKSTVDLGGYVTDIQATGERLLVARYDYGNYGETNNGRTDLSILDISSPTGTVVEGASIKTAGFVENKHNMNLDGDILRVVSGNHWNSETGTNHVETFDASDIDNLTLIDHKTFGDNEDLFATLFLGEKAFFVTYRRVDPFHAFEITTEGLITEKSEFVVSGWNDYFKPVELQTRLIGIGKNDENGNTMAVSLYDITDLTNPNPLITREEIDLNWSWSEANWDDRAFSVLEKATQVNAPSGELETGLVLLPFSGWDDDEDRYVSAVQIFTFSASTLTLRGVMDHGTPVRRSFVADPAENTTGNLSEAELSLFDTTDTDQPVELGRVELAPNYTDFLVYGSYGVRRQDRNSYYGWWGYRSDTMPADSLEVVPLSGDVDLGTPVAEISIPAGARVFQVGDLLVVVDSQRDESSGWEDPVYDTEMQVWDLGNPASPVARGSLSTDELPGGYRYDYGYGSPEVDGECFNCDVAWWGYGSGPDVAVVDDGLVFVEVIYEQELVGNERVTSSYPRYEEQRWESCYDENYESTSCTYLTGGITCRQLTDVDGTVHPEVCTGAFYSCTQDEDGEQECDETTLTASQTETNTWTNERYRYWQHYDLHVVDVSDADQPALAATLSMANDEEGVEVLSKGDDLYVSFKKPYTVPGDSRPYVRYYFRRYDLSTPSSPSATADINVPGELVAVEGDTVITRDFLWGEAIVETSINALTISNGLAYLQGVHRFTDQQVEGLHLDGQGKLLVTHSEAYWANGADYGYGYGSSGADDRMKLTLLDLDATDLPALSTTPIDSWAQLRGAIAGRAMFTVPGGMLVVNLDNPAQPYAQAYFPMRGWPQDVVVDGRRVYMAAGSYGLYDISLDTENLLSTP